MVKLAGYATMSKLVLIVLLVIGCGQEAVAKTINESTIVGRWQTHKIYPSDKLLKLMKKLDLDAELQTPEWLLIVTKDLQATFSANHNGQEYTFELKDTSLEVIDDLVILKLFKSNRELAYKIILSGYQSGSGAKLIFGTVYLYKNGNVYSGWPIDLEASDEGE